MKKIFCFLIWFLPGGFCLAQSGHPTYVPPVYEPLPLGAIEPKGWLLSQLKIMRNGTTGHLDEVYEKIKNDNGWLGGKGDNWEETPYWLDGAVPLAWLLKDSILQHKVMKYINWTLDNQRPSGYFGPVTKAEREEGIQITHETADKGEDWWPKMIMLKVLQQYYTATGDKRVVPFVTRYFHYQMKTLEKVPIGNWTQWAEARGTENMLVAQWLFGITKDESLMKLSDLIRKQSFPWNTWMAGRDWVIHAAAYQGSEHWMSRHGVNVAMGIKDPVLQFQRNGDSAYLKTMRTGFMDLMTLHGLPMGIFSADEDLHGNNPVQGVELCAIVEAMFSLENAIAISGDPSYADALERMAFNVLPAQTTDDYNEKQYFQIANQVQVKRGIFNFTLPFNRQMNNVFGMRSGYTCCLANMHQGFTKFATHLWYKSQKNGLAALAYAPNKVTTTAGTNNIPVTINTLTDYPFGEEILFRFEMDQPGNFDLGLRIPSWCEEASITINGQVFKTGIQKGMVFINRRWQNKDEVKLILPMEVKTSVWGSNSRAVERGPLVYALKIKERWEKGHQEVEGDYRSIFPASDWNFALLEKSIQEPVGNFTVKTVKNITSDFAWNLEHVPVEILTRAKKIPAWTIYNDVAPQPITDRNGIYKGEVNEEEEIITLVPFGFTKIRIVAFPVVK